ncbi:DUF3558 domain-containing protein [Nocardia sp. NPDC005366]|uniref:DUF3558 domain-containing protein n=1 Tax=Nocardia sp. NPDC005366 TaxID=3156878 RepID=UPI0033B0DBDA
MKKHLTGAAFGLMVALSVAGCEKDQTPDVQATSIQPSSVQISVSVPPAPPQVNNGRNSVLFDPCFKIGDDTVSKIGYDPATRKRNDFIFDNYSFIGCAFDRKGNVRGQMLPVGSLAVSSTNITLGEFRSREGDKARTISVSGREAITYKDASSETCTIVVAAADGVVNIQKSSYAAFTTERPCDRLEEIAAIVVSEVPN